MNQEQETAMYDQPDDDFPCCARPDIVTGEPLPYTEEQIGYMLADRRLRIHSIVFLTLSVMSVALIGVAGRVLGWF